MAATPPGRGGPPLGAVPGSCLLNDPTHSRWFDVEHYRTVAHRRVTVRAIDASALVLGSTQPMSTVDTRRADATGVSVVRRRSGGGAVRVDPDDPLWVDVWLPRGDPLWHDDVVDAARWVGEWWASALASAGAGDLSVHDGASAPRPWSEVACFAGLGPGEVEVDGRKVVGVSQWRGRQGALFQTCAYRRFDGSALVGLLDLAGGPAAGGVGLAEHLRTAAVGTADVAGPTFGVSSLLDHLPAGPSWESVTG